MGETIANMLPTMLIVAVLPAPTIVVLVLLRGAHGLTGAAAFVGGMTIVRLAQGALFGFVLVDALTARGSEGPGTVVATLLLVLGIFLWITAVRLLRKEPDPDEPPPPLLGKLKVASPLAAFGMGAALVAVAAKQWVFTLSALGIIGEASLSRTEAVLAYVIFVLGAEVLVLLPLVAYVVSRERAAVVLGRVGTWLEAHNRQIKIVVSIVFGSYFLWKGISGLIG
jgi:hypothetical protein